MFCSNCGKQIPVNSQFCQLCGAKQGVVNLAPQQTDPAPTQNQAPMTVTRGTRFTHYLLDLVIIIIGSFILEVMFSFIDIEVNEDNQMFFSLFIVFAYYIISELIWQKSPAKFITNTKVAMKDGSKPDFAHILGRTASRLIPFEQLSFLFKTNPIGWHDKFSGTMVVPDNYTPEQIKSIKKI